MLVQRLGLGNRIMISLRKINVERWIFFSFIKGSQRHEQIMKSRWMLKQNSNMLLKCQYLP